MIKTVNLKQNLKKIVIFVIILLIIFCILYYKNFLFGNNIIKNRSEKEIEQILTNLQNYKAQIDVKVTSNKTTNYYQMYQEVKEDYSMQEIINGENISGVKIEIRQNNLKIKNSKLKLEKIYEDYKDIFNNAIFLNTFANEYQNPENISNYYEENSKIILEITLQNNPNTYIKYKKLYIDSQTLLPTKLEIKGNNKKETISIIYNSIEINQ